MPKKLKKKCCKKYRRKGKACGNCPLMARLEKDERHKLAQRHASEYEVRKRRRKIRKKLKKKAS